VLHTIYLPSYYLISRTLQTVSQLFGLHLPVDITHLQALLSLIYHSLDTYLQRVFDQLGIDQPYIFLTVVTESSSCITMEHAI